MERLPGDSIERGAASGFGGGIGRAGLVCGAISGAAIVAGIRGGGPSEAGERDRLYAGVLDLVRSFESEFGTTTCRKLIGFDISTSEGLKEARDSGVFVDSCPGFVEFCARGILERLSDARVEEVRDEAEVKEE